MNTTFTNWDYLSQAYPGFYPDAEYPALTGAMAANWLGYTYDGSLLDSIYRMKYTFKHSASTLHLDFIGVALQEIEDESWGLDNVIYARTQGSRPNSKYTCR